jgi:hypothetical protein
MTFGVEMERILKLIQPPIPRIGCQYIPHGRIAITNRSRQNEEMDHQWIIG